MSHVASDFDRIARAMARPQPLGRYAEDVARRPRGGRVLDVGCGMGALARALDAREVIGLDLSPEMIRRAREVTDDERIRFEVADFMSWEPDGEIDHVVSVNALHHMPFEAALARMASMLEPGGTLEVVDLCASRPIVDLPRDLAALALGALDRWRVREDPAIDRAWRAHGRNDSYLRFDTVRRSAMDVLPGCRVQRLLRFRYALFWVSPRRSTRDPGSRRDLSRR